MELSLRHINERPSRIRRDELSILDFDRRIESLFDSVFGTSLVSYVMPETRGLFSPRTDIKETKKNFKVVSEIPGMDPKDIEVSVHNGMLTISGEKNVEKEEKETDYHHVERSYGCFCRSIMLPDGADADKVTSVYKNGVLTVTIPKTEKALEESKKIPVTPA
ncbi:MAG: Spore protein SP21 [Syntrophorhabdaceae bacterium PtaU1.Bin034]|jgi:HSP20 family molecular chaperone IbpA|nr:MAG: Spore protein SP21 [Syntrophorhabdaceae bacterium PtaU1.Bin034]